MLQVSQLNGFGSGSGATPLTLSLVGTGSSGTTATVSLPGGVAAGDLAIYMQYAGGSGGPVLGVPSGYTQMVEQLGGDAGGQAGYKVLTGGETEIATGTTASPNDIGTVCVVYRPSRAIVSIDYGTWNKQFTSGNPSEQTVDPSAFDGPAIILGLAGGVSVGSFGFSVATPAFDATLTADGSNVYSVYGYKLYDENPQSHAIDMGDQGPYNILAAGYLVVS